MKTALVGSLGLLLTLVIACSNDASPPPSAAAAPAATSVPPSTATPAPAANAPRVIATAEGTIPGTRVDVTELKRSSGGTVTLRFALVNESDRAINVSDVGELLDMNVSFSVYPVGGVHLIDPVGRKKYFVARDAENKCVCSGFEGLAKGGRANHWAKFPAPPDDVEKISIVIPVFSPLDDVPISR